MGEELEGNEAVAAGLVRASAYVSACGAGFNRGR